MIAAGTEVAADEGMVHVVREVEDDRIRLRCGRLTRPWSALHPRGMREVEGDNVRTRCAGCAGGGA